MKFSTCEPCSWCAQRMARAVRLGNRATSEDYSLYPNPSCAGWRECNCACQAAVRMAERRKSRTAPRKPKDAPNLTDPLFEVP